MNEKIIAGLLAIFMCCLALYKVFVKPSLSRNHLDEAFGIPSIISRVVRVVLGIGAILLGLYEFLQAAGIFNQT